MNGKQNGNGNFNYQNGDKYSGDFKDGLFSGQGKMTYSNKDIYEGKFSEPKNLLKDFLYFFETFKGRWLNGKQNGNGTFNFKIGDKYTGDFKDAFFSEQGKMNYSNGDIYEGKFNEPIYLLKVSIYFFENFL